MYDTKTEILLARPVDKTPADPLLPRNAHLDSGDWLQNIIWDSRKISADFGDADEEDEADSENGMIEKPAAEGLTEAQIAAQAKLDPYNISNDHLYEHTREAKFRIRQTFGNIEVVHSTPAKKLQLPWVSVFLHAFTDHFPVQDVTIEIRSPSMASSGFAVPYWSLFDFFQTQIESRHVIFQEEGHGRSRGAVQDFKGSHIN